jgi:8-hydroxy-5-deazaflavin:NADPH oxidoreductase
MIIGVIGVGEMGGTLARVWREKGHQVRVANSRGADGVRKFAAVIGAEACDVYGAVEGADVILLAMAFPVAATLPSDIFAKAKVNAIIVDTSNYYPDVRDHRIADIDSGTPESVWVSERLGRPIFKAFNSIMFFALANRGQPKGSPGRLAIPVAGGRCAR